MTPPESRRAALEIALCRYLSNHPEARDTVEGIGHWWIPERGDPANEIEAVLNLMVERKWMQTWRAVSVNVYGLNPAALPEIRRFLLSAPKEI